MRPTTQRFAILLVSTLVWVFGAAACGVQGAQEEVEKAREAEQQMEERQQELEEKLHEGHQKVEERQ